MVWFLGDGECHLYRLARWPWRGRTWRWWSWLFEPWEGEAMMACGSGDHGERQGRDGSCGDALHQWGDVHVRGVPADVEDGYGGYGALEGKRARLGGGRGGCDHTRRRREAAEVCADGVLRRPGRRLSASMPLMASSTGKDAVWIGVFGAFIWPGEVQAHSGHLEELL